MTAYPGFPAPAASVPSKGGFSAKHAAAILAAATRGASAKAKRAKPSASKVPGADYSNPAND
jgi:hypothetical protein